MEIYSKTLAKKITDYLDSEDFRYNFLEEDGVIAFSFNMDGLGQLNYLIRLLDSAYLVEVFPNNMQLVENSQKLTELVCKINHSLSCGNFDYYPEDGSIKFRMAADCCEESLPTQNMLKSIIDLPYYMFDKSKDAFLEIAQQQAELENIKMTLFDCKEE